VPTGRRSPSRMVTYSEAGELLSELLGTREHWASSSVSSRPAGSERDCWRLGGCTRRRVGSSPARELGTLPVQCLGEHSVPSSGTTEAELGKELGALRHSVELGKLGWALGSSGRSWCRLGAPLKWN
jgi:hypothetical protein